MKARNRLATAALATVLTGVAIGGVALASAPGSDPSRTAMSTPMGMGGMHGPGMGGREMASMSVANEFDYLTTMIPHHEEAIRSAELLRDGTDRPELRAFAESIIDTQTREVGQMRTWLAERYAGRETAVDYTPMMGELTGLRGAELDRAFLSDMVPHHMMAVMMSQQLLRQDLATGPEIARFAQGVSDTQMAEIGQMRGWLTGAGH